jgi:hypothetical protein
MHNDDQWAPLPGEFLQSFLNDINPIDGRYKTSPQTSEVSWHDLPFYDDVVLIQVNDKMWSPRHLTVYYLLFFSQCGEGHLLRLDGTWEPIHEVNAKAQINITEETVLDYLKFYCFFVRGEEGPFLIVEDVNKIHMPKNVDPNIRSVIVDMVRPANFEGKDKNGLFLCDAVVFYSNCLFVANFAIGPRGMIEMLDDDPIATDLPVMVDAPISAERHGNLLLH